MRTTLAFLLLFTLVSVFAVSSVAAADGHEAAYGSGEVMTHPARGEVVAVDGAEAHLVRSAAGITMNFATRELTPGHVYTAWWAFFEEPSACAASPCTSADMADADAVRANVLFADSLVAAEDGSGNFFAHLSPGEISNGWFANAFTDPMGAEVHIALHDHGPLIETMRDEMLNSYRGGCRDDSLPSPPASAYADGPAGPNTCQMWQFSIFLAQKAQAGS